MSTLNPQVVKVIGTGADQIEEVQHDHDLKKLLDRPHPDFPRSLILRLTTQWLVTTGESYLLKVSSKMGGVPMELHPIPPTNIWPVIDHGVTIGYRSVDGDGKEKDHEPDTVIRFYWPDPENPWASEGYLGPAGIVADAQKFSNQHLRYHFEHDATPKSVLEATDMAEDWDPDSRERFAELWNKNYNNRHGDIGGGSSPAILPTGYKLIQMALQSGEDVTPLLNYWRDDLLMAFGTPRSVLGQVVSGDRSSAETNAFVFDMHTILPIANLISDILTLKLAPDFADDVLVKFQEFVAKDKAHLLMQEGQDLQLKVRTINQVREDRNLKGVEWGEYPVGTPQDMPYDGSEPEPEPPGGPTGEDDGRMRVNALRSIFAIQKREIVKDLVEKHSLALVTEDWTPIFQLRMPWLSADEAQSIHNDTVAKIQQQYLLSDGEGEDWEQLATRMRRVFNERRRDAPEIVGLNQS
jgi:hypothetical protein